MTGTSRRLRAIAAIATITLAAAACGSTDSTGSRGGSGHEITLAYSVEVLNESQSAAIALMKLHVHELQAKGIPVKLDVFSADGDVSRQISDIEAIATRKTDGLLILPVDPAGVVAAVDAAASQGVKVVDARGTIESRNVSRYMGIDEKHIGQLAADATRKYLEDHPGTVLRFGLINGAEATATTHIRVDAIKELAKEMPDRVKILAEAFGDWDTEKATSIMEDWSVRYPTMNAVATASDEMARGVVNVLRSKGDVKDMLIYGVNGSQDGLNMVKAGDLDWTIGINIRSFASGMIDAGVAAVQGKLKVGDTFAAPEDVTILVDSNNVNDVIAKAAADELAAKPYM